MHSFDVTLSSDTGKYTYRFEFEWEPYVPGNYTGPIDNSYPDEGGFGDITKITVLGERPEVLNDNQTAELIVAIKEEYGEDYLNDTMWEVAETNESEYEYDSGEY
jgi:hypothetical protein